VKVVCCSPSAIAMTTVLVLQVEINFFLEKNQTELVVVYVINVIRVLSFIHSLNQSINQSIFLVLLTSNNIRVVVIVIKRSSTSLHKATSVYSPAPATLSNDSNIIISLCLFHASSANFCLATGSN
jgi:hypothetical protein